MSIEKRISQLLERKNNVKNDSETGTTTNSYVDLASVIIEYVNGISVIVSNTGDTNSLNYKILASNDNTNFIELVSEAALAHSTSVGYNATVNYKYVKVSVKSATPDAHTTVKVDIYAK